MSETTTYFDLVKPSKTDGLKVADINGNMDIIDLEMHKPPLSINNIFPDPITRNLYLPEVPLANNLSSDIAQVNYGTFIQRTSGGDSSISDGSASLLSIKGGYVRTGYVPESINMTITPGEDSEITATINRDTFVQAVSVSGTTTLTYTSEWSADPATYGITVTGTPVSGDTITVVYVKEERGTITVATPSTFNSTGWNLYNNAAGVQYAKVVAYSQQYGYRIGGSYTSITFAPDLTSEPEPVTVTDGIFYVEEDGYIFVTGGNATTYIYPTWSDWGSGYAGSFQSYTVVTIDLSEVMVKFPYGLMEINGVYDEINVNAQRAIKRTQRLEYTEQNLATVIASGVAYVYDTNYIYAVLETPVSESITLNGTYTVSDHGIEYFTGTEVPCAVETLYGENLKDKLRTDVLTISQQSLTTAQKSQVLNNIGAASSMEVATLANTVSGKQNTLSIATKNYTGPSGVSIYARKYGAVVNININGTATATISSGTTLATLDSAYRPVRTQECLGSLSSSTHVMFSIGTDGVITCKENITTSAKYPRLCVTYIASGA